jgi:hypothetical protein
MADELEKNKEERSGIQNLQRDTLSSPQSIPPNLPRGDAVQKPQSGRPSGPIIQPPVAGRPITHPPLRVNPSDTSNREGVGDRTADAQTTDINKPPENKTPTPLKTPPPPMKPSPSTSREEKNEEVSSTRTDEINKPTELERAIKGGGPRPTPEGTVVGSKAPPVKPDVNINSTAQTLGQKSDPLSTKPQQEFDKEKLSGNTTPSAPRASDRTPSATKSSVDDGLSIVRPLRTYKSDVDDAMREKKVSVAGMATAKQDRVFKLKTKVPTKPPLKVTPPTVNKPPSKTSNKTTMRVVSALLIIAALALLIFFYFKFRPPAVPAGSEITSFIFVDDLKTINVTGKDTDSFARELTGIVNSNALPVGAVTHIYTTKGGGEEVKPLAADEFLRLIGAEPPSSLNRSLISVFMIGTHVTEDTEPFMIFQTGFYENVFAGMLEWEKQMVTDFEDVLGYDLRFRLGLDQSAVIALELPDFEDVVIQNKDARVMRDPNGETILLYSFLNRQTVVITTNENTLNEIARRLTTTRTAN